jgi:hypothetical protein
MNSGLVQAQHIMNRELEAASSALTVCTISLRERSNLRSPYTSSKLLFDLFQCFVMSLQPDATPVFTSIVVDPTTDVAPSFSAGPTETSGVAPVFTGMSDILIPDMSLVTKEPVNRILRICGQLSFRSYSFQVKRQCWCHRGWRRRRSGRHYHSCHDAVLDSTKIPKSAPCGDRGCFSTSTL